MSDCKPFFLWYTPTSSGIYVQTIVSYDLIDHLFVNRNLMSVCIGQTVVEAIKKFTFKGDYTIVDYIKPRKLTILFYVLSIQYIL